jgi:hypothetical protein
MNLVARYDYPGTVFQAMTVVQIQRGEPDARLFEWTPGSPQAAHIEQTSHPTFRLPGLAWSLKQRTFSSAQIDFSTLMAG